VSRRFLSHLVPDFYKDCYNALSILGYNSEPARLQNVISQIFEHATSRISFDGIACAPQPLFNVLDSKNAKDYVARVEPSAQGGEKMANAFVSQIEKMRSSKRV